MKIPGPHLKAVFLLVQCGVFVLLVLLFKNNNKENKSKTLM